MAIAMMNLTPQTAAMMGVTAVDKMLILNFAQNVNANSTRHVPLDIMAHWWVMVIATMNSTIQTASMMAWTAVDLVIVHNSCMEVQHKTLLKAWKHQNHIQLQSYQSFDRIWWNIRLLMPQDGIWHWILNELSVTVMPGLNLPKRLLAGTTSALEQRPLFPFVHRYAQGNYY